MTAPVLVALDFKTREARRYFPRPGQRPLVVDQADICAPEEQGPTFPHEIEKFRQGPPKKVSVPR